MSPVFFASYYLSSLPREIEKKSSSKHMRVLKEDSFEAGFRILLSQDLNFLILLLRKSLDRPAIAAPPGWSHAKAKWGRKSCGANGWNLGKVRGMMGSHVTPPKKSGFVWQISQNIIELPLISGISSLVLNGVWFDKIPYQGQLLRNWGCLKTIIYCKW